MARERLCEILSSLANCDINERDFLIGQPNSLGGAITSVMVRPRNTTRRYGFQNVRYTRFDLSRLKRTTVIYRGEHSTRELMQRPELGVAYNYRIASRRLIGVSTPRCLILRPEDVVDEPLNPTSANTDIVLRAIDDSDMFIGSRTITLQLT